MSACPESRPVADGRPFFLCTPTIQVDTIATTEWWIGGRPTGIEGRRVTCFDCRVRHYFGSRRGTYAIHDIRWPFGCRPSMLFTIGLTIGYFVTITTSSSRRPSGAIPGDAQGSKFNKGLLHRCDAVREVQPRCARRLMSSRATSRTPEASPIFQVSESGERPSHHGGSSPITCA